MPYTLPQIGEPSAGPEAYGEAVTMTIAALVTRDGRGFVVSPSCISQVKSVNKHIQVRLHL